MELGPRITRPFVTLSFDLNFEKKKKKKEEEEEKKKAGLRHDDWQSDCMWLISCDHCPVNALAIVEAGGVAPLVNLLKAPADMRAPEWAALTIQYSAQHHRQVQVGALLLPI